MTISAQLVAIACTSVYATDARQDPVEPAFLEAASRSPTRVPASVRCATAVEWQLDSWDAREDVLVAPSFASDSTRLRWPTGRIGVWIELNASTTGQPTLTRISPDAKTMVTWDARCRPSLRDETARFVRSPADAPAFRDADLESLLQSNAAVAVYVWSPHMPLSVEGGRHLLNAATRAGVRAVLVVDPRADRAYAVAAARNARLPSGTATPALSLELLFRNMFVHAPSLLVYVNGRAAGPALPGYRDAAEYERVLREHARRSR